LEGGRVERRSNRFFFSSARGKQAKELGLFPPPFTTILHPHKETNSWVLYSHYSSQQPRTNRRHSIWGIGCGRFIFLAPQNLTNFWWHKVLFFGELIWWHNFAGGAQLYP